MSKHALGTLAYAVDVTPGYAWVERVASRLEMMHHARALKAEHGSISRIKTYGEVYHWVTFSDNYEVVYHVTE